MQSLTAFPLFGALDRVNAHSNCLLGRLGGYFFIGEHKPRTRFLYHASGVKGRVVDDVEHAPIRNAFVLAHRNGGADVHVRTDANGKYVIPLPLGIYDVFISAEGFTPTSRKIEVTPDGMMIFDVALKFDGLGMQID